MGNSYWFFLKLFTHSDLLMEHFVTIDAGVTDADFRGAVQALVVNHHPDKSFTVRTEDRIAEVVFMKKFHANFVKVFDESLLGMVGFGSAGFGVIKKLKKDPESELTTSELTTSESDQTTSQNSCKLLAICDKSSDDLQISSEKAVMVVNNEVVVSIKLDE